MRIFSCKLKCRGRSKETLRVRNSNSHNLGAFLPNDTEKNLFMNEFSYYTNKVSQKHPISKRDVIYTQWTKVFEILNTYIPIIWVSSCEILDSFIIINKNYTTQFENTITKLLHYLRFVSSILCGIAFHLFYFPQLILHRFVKF